MSRRFRAYDKCEGDCKAKRPFPSIAVFIPVFPVFCFMLLMIRPLTEYGEAIRGAHSLYFEAEYGAFCRSARLPLFSGLARFTAADWSPDGGESPVCAGGSCQRAYPRHVKVVGRHARSLCPSREHFLHNREELFACRWLCGEPCT